MSIGGTRISNASIVNVADEEKQEGCISEKDEGMSLPKLYLKLAQLHDDDEDVFATSLIDRYVARPVSLQNICLATFTVTYDVIQSSTNKEETEDVNTEEEMQNTENDNSMTKIKLSKGLGVIRKRNRKQFHIHVGTKSMQNQKNITIQSFFCITHGIMQMT